MSTRVKIIIAVLVIAILGVIAYLVFFNTNNDTTAVSTGSGAPASAAEVTFLNLASQINPITFDTTIFSDPRFTALVDIHTAILPEATGRTDPFSTQ
jgi:phosphatidylserine synthase